MKELLDLKGIISVLNTPFNDENEIDIGALKLNVENAIEAGIRGFLVPAMASEVEKLTLEERKSLLTATIEKKKTMDPSVKVIGGIYTDPKRRKAMASEYIDLGCDGILINIPYVDRDSFRKQIHEIAELKPPFLMIQDWDFKGFGIPIDLLIDLWREIDCLKSIKVEVVPAGVKYSKLLEASNNKLHVTGGWAVMQMIEALERGVHAFMPTGMHDIYVKIYNLFIQGKEKEARSLFYRLLPVLAFSNQHLDISVHFFKHLLYEQGIYPTANCRDPILEFDTIHKKTAFSLIKRIQKIKNEIKRAG